MEFLAIDIQKLCLTGRVMEYIGIAVFRVTVYYNIIASSDTVLL